MVKHNFNFFFTSNLFFSLWYLLVHLVSESLSFPQGHKNVFPYFSCPQAIFTSTWWVSMDYLPFLVLDRTPCWWGCFFYPGRSALGPSRPQFPSDQVCVLPSSSHPPSQPPTPPTEPQNQGETLGLTSLIGGSCDS